jgi:hypothetical protein
MDMKNPQKVKLFQELLKIILIVNNKQPIEDMNQTEFHISDSKKKEKKERSSISNSFI